MYHEYCSRRNLTFALCRPSRIVGLEIRILVGPGNRMLSVDKGCDWSNQLNPKVSPRSKLAPTQDALLRVTVHKAFLHDVA